MCGHSHQSGAALTLLFGDFNLQRNILGQTVDTEIYNTNLDLTGKIQLGFSKHEVLVGFDYHKSTQKYHNFGEFIFPNPDLDINIFNPAHSYGIDPALIRATLSRLGAYYGGSDFSVTNTEWYGAYFQDHITLWDKLHILGGGRHDWVTTGGG